MSFIISDIIRSLTNLGGEKKVLHCNKCNTATEHISSSGTKIADSVAMKMFMWLNDLNPLHNVVNGKPFWCEACGAYQVSGGLISGLLNTRPQEIPDLGITASGFEDSVGSYYTIHFSEQLLPDDIVVVRIKDQHGNYIKAIPQYADKDGDYFYSPRIFDGFLARLAIFYVTLIYQSPSQFNVEITIIRTKDSGECFYAGRKVYSDDFPPKPDWSKVDMLTPCVQLCMEVARSDGHISKSEVSTIKGLFVEGFSLSKSELPHLRKVMKEPLSASIEESVKLALFRFDRADMSDILQLMVQTAYADGRITVQEINIITRIIRCFGIDEESIPEILADFELTIPELELDLIKFSDDYGLYISIYFEEVSAPSSIMVVLITDSSGNFVKGSPPFVDEDGYFVHSFQPIQATAERFSIFFGALGYDAPGEFHIGISLFEDIGTGELQLVGREVLREHFPQKPKLSRIETLRPLIHLYMLVASADGITAPDVIRQARALFSETFHLTDAEMPSLGEAMKQRMTLSREELCRLALAA